MGFDMNVQEEEIDEEYDNACNNMLAQQAVMSNMPNSNDKMDSIQQQLNSMTQMFQHTMNLAASKPLPPGYQQPFQQQMHP